MGAVSHLPNSLWGSRNYAISPRLSVQTTFL
jgi:hypothetical protein